MNIKKLMNEVNNGVLIPNHLAIIMDGNGRWAKAKGKPRTDGHIAGVDALRRTLTACGNMGVKVLTVYAFSTENWNRPKEEVDALMDLLVQAIVNETPELMKQGIRLDTIGDINKLPEKSLSYLQDCKKTTSVNSNMTLVLALSYSSKDEIVRAVRRIKSSYSSEEINQDLISNELDTKDLPELDLLIRTGGEMRLSNFMLWQAAYAELFFSKTLWPDFGENDLIEAFRSYGERERRFGLTSEQIKDNNNE